MFPNDPTDSLDCHVSVAVMCMLDLKTFARAIAYSLVGV